jgi:phosphatidylinositol-3-phosphatase
MRGWLLVRLRAAVAAAATLTGKRFGLLVASSVVATSAIVAAAATNQPEASPLASVLGHSLAADRTPVAAVEPSAEAEPEAEGEPAEAVGNESTPAPEPVITSEPEPEPVFVPEETAPEVAPEAEPESTPEEEAPSEPEVPAKPEAGRVKHVFVVNLVSSGYQAAFGKTSAMPYLSGTLLSQGTLLSHYEVLDQGTTANGIAAISGQPPNKKTKEGCPVFESFPSTSTTTKAGIVTGDGCAYNVEVQNLATQFETVPFTWHAYMEDMVSPTTGEPENCVYPATEPEVPVTGGYSAQLNPFANFHSLLDLGACSTNDVPITELKKDLKSEKKTANYSYISPDLCSAGVTGQCPEGAPTGAAAADAWLEATVPLIVESPAFKKDGLLIIAFNGVNAAEPGAPAAAKPLRTGALLISQFATPGAIDAAPYNPYSLLRSSEELFGLGLLAKAADPKTKSFAQPLLGEENGGD